MDVGPSYSSFTNDYAYDVFLSFRGEDTRHGFTGHLYNALENSGIRTFIDDEKLQRGEQIRPALVKAIQQSKIAIIVLSKHYASSSFCLHELTAILDYFKVNQNRLVLPVFYKVHPSDVRHQNGSYEVALARHEESFKADKEKLQKWKNALRQVANFSGYHFKDGDEYEYKFVEKIVEDVSSVINRTPLHVVDYPSGLESQVHVGCGVHINGIHRMGGIEKSTLAQAVYNNLVVENFDGLCFLKNVREESNKYGLHLQRIMLSKMLGDTDINMTCWDEGISQIKSRKDGRLSLMRKTFKEERQLNSQGLPLLCSQNTVSSSFFLHQLATFIDRYLKGNKDWLVLSLFYKVDPSDLPHQHSSYEERLKAEKEKLEKLKNAMH